MFKIYGVSPQKEHPENSSFTPSLIQEDILTDTSESITPETNYPNNDTDLGQIALDVLDFSDKIIIVAPIAGVDPADVDISLSRNILTLSGTRTEPKIYDEAKRMLVEECFYGNFSRSIILPENLGFDEIDATVEHNVITIRIPKLKLISKSISVKK